ncbi:hypothetical protein FWH09_01235 [Candidatus Saccharibacteria bacterium]|nr:hypothetical protein [Candidatus Saccharibacteria bacterium]
MGLVVKNDYGEDDALSARIAEEMRRKASENSGEGEKLELPESDEVEDSAYMEKYSESEKNPYVWRVVLVFAIAGAVILGFIAVM